MDHLIIEKKHELKFILNDFFKKGYTRKSKPENMSNYDNNTYSLACNIYKRGFINLCNISKAKAKIPLPVVLCKENFENAIQKIPSEKYFFIVDENFLNKQPTLKNIVHKNYRYISYFPEESTKIVDTVQYLIQTIPKNVEYIFAVGGGITLDIAGFVAGLLNLKIHYLPTTLLASVDAAIGGKTGVNYPPYGKNQVGLFYEAETLYCVPEYFSTLSYESVVCGLCEAIKHAWIFGEFANDRQTIERIYDNKGTASDFSYLVSKSIFYKAYVVNHDPFETKDIRTALNFGHTLAHILEALGEEGILQKIPHGIAVAHGIFFLLETGFCDLSSHSKDFVILLKKITKKYKIKIIKKITEEDIKKYLSQDKKNENLDDCSLSLPSYGHFSLNNEQNKFMPVTKSYSLQDISCLMRDYILSSFNPN